MATYYGTYGQKVQYLASDPTDVQVGQVWYNYTSATLKVRSFSTASWASGGNMPQPQGKNTGSGIQTAALTFGGFNATTGSSGSVITQSYDGSSWAAAPNMNVATFGGNGCGTQSATFKNGGYNAALGYLNRTEHYNGSSWSTQTNSPRSVNEGTSNGVQPAVLVSGGFDGTNWSQSCLLWTSSAWTTGPSFASPSAVGSQGAGSAGTQTAAIIFGGYSGLPVAPGSGSQTFNGSAFSNAPNLNNPAYRSGAGTQTAAIAFGQGDPSPSGTSTWTELYNGTSWTNTTAFSVARGDANANSATNAPNSTALIFGGRPPGPGGTNSTEEFTGAVATTKTVTVS
jgi:hypothetical protein